MQDDELMHYGVRGMRWGVSRSMKKLSRNDRYSLKATKYGQKAEKFHTKSENRHYKKDQDSRERRFAIHYGKKTKRLSKKLVTKDLSDAKRSRLETKVAKAEYKKARFEREANRIGRNRGYGFFSNRWAKKSDKYAQKAAKMEYKIAKNKRYVEATAKKISTLSAKDLDRGKKYIDAFNSARGKRTYYPGNKDVKLNKTAGVSITRDKNGKITSVSANNKQSKKNARYIAKKVAANGDY